MDQTPTSSTCVPKEGSTLFIDNLAIPRDARDPELAHAFLDFTLEADDRRRDLPDDALLEPEPGGVAAPAAGDPRPPGRSSRRPTSSSASSCIRDLGDATVLYDRLWTEVKSE